MAEMTMLSMAVMAANKKGRSLSEATAGRKDLYLTEGPAEEADVIYLPDYSLSLIHISTIIMLKNPFTMVWVISSILIWFSARYVHTPAMIPTLSFPTTVMIALFIFILLTLLFY